MTKYTEKEFTVIIEQGEDGYYISDVLELSGCHTQAKTMDELIKRTREVIELCLESAHETIEERFVGIQKIRVPA